MSALQRRLLEGNNTHNLIWHGLYRAGYFYADFTPSETTKRILDIIDDLTNDQTNELVMKAEGIILQISEGNLTSEQIIFTTITETSPFTYSNGRIVALSCTLLRVAVHFASVGDVGSVSKVIEILQQCLDRKTPKVMPWVILYRYITNSLMNRPSV